jgi:uncharacterized protein
MRAGAGGRKRGRDACEHARVARLRVRLTPRAHRDAVDGVRDGLVLARVRAPPADGRANAALVKLVARTLGVPASRVDVVRGHSAREKLVAVDGIDDAAALRLLEDA